jgi:hypothetical protein
MVNFNTTSDFVHRYWDTAEIFTAAPVVNPDPWPTRPRDITPTVANDECLRFEDGTCFPYDPSLQKYKEKEGKCELTRRFEYSRS